MMFSFVDQVQKKLHQFKKKYLPSLILRSKEKIQEIQYLTSFVK